MKITQNRWVWYYLWAYKTWGLHYKQQQAGCNTQWTQQKAGPVALLKPPSVNIHLSSMATHTGHSTRSFEVCRTPHPHEKTLGSNIFCLHLCEILNFETNPVLWSCSDKALKCAAFLFLLLSLQDGWAACFCGNKYKSGKAKADP